MKKLSHFVLIGVSTTVFLLMASAATHNLVAPTIVTQGDKHLSTSLVTQAGGAYVGGAYDGTVSLIGAYTGVFSDSGVVPTTGDLGYIDLAFLLDQTNGAVNGYVNLDRTLVFSTEHVIQVTPVGPTPSPGTPSPTPVNLAVGPSVAGTFDGGSTVSLVSEPFSMVLSPQRTLQDGRILPEQRVTRQFQLVTSKVEQNGATLVGTYRETLWGYAPQPSTLVGTFVLQRPTASEVGPNLPEKLYLPTIRR